MSNVNRTVLVVEDEPLIRLQAVEFLEAAGYAVLECQNADEAINILKARNDIQLVFTDVDMPGSMDGLKLAHFVRDRWPPIKIVVASGMRILEDDQMPPGARFFSKPYDEPAILTTLTELLRDEPR